ncbi:RagB/SusD family nutrient uptake outer membrane protein [Winogradskyella echinorum]|uniref:RagB/SusD family nutrient uptake outer membrane protein n=1 Tax=Winogradskyella echinorum TaxID=538189 RepID=A0ABR6XXT4_9FLAO|nr:RagB/SusD family nutrient uptake outer membrane protein [Winogradskyella echinorum]MBC3844788.1 RagB/SusD family nutrient uptake outer membrane protein [Winogradskyella echinorum]MBC5749136.1 RagB/SusD family nutrient uptake outer membrane protein [Winogradskyella echinorum]
MKNIKYLVVIIFGFILYACDTEDFLNPDPESAITQDTFFQTDDDVLAAIVGVYDAFQGVNENTDTNIGRVNRGVQFEHLLTEHRSDNTRNATLEGSKSDFHRYTVVANNVESEDYYASMYQAIFRANTVLNFIGVADEQNQASYQAEAKFLRAYAYFKLVRMYGDIPLVTTPVEAENLDALFTRVPVAEVYAQIVEDLLEAVNNLDNTYKSRASRAAAQGILAKVYMSQPNPNYTGARLLCETIISGMDYSLQSNYNDVFYNELNSEIIFAIQYQTGNALESQSFSSEFTSTFRQGREDGQNIVNANLFADFTTYGGNRTEFSITNLGFLGQDENEVIKYLPDGSDITTSPPTYGTSTRDAGNDYIALRYADVLLLHVEAVIGDGTVTSDPDALNSFQEVRNRAGLTDLVTSVSKSDLLKERRVELAFENQRWFDLLRFGVADTVLASHAADRGYVFNPGRDLLLPIPASEINLSGGRLTQNPNY